MITISKNNSVLASMDIFVASPDQQWQLIDQLTAYTKAILAQQSGYLSNAIHRSLDGKRVINYTQWKSSGDYQKYRANSDALHETTITGFYPPDAHLYEIFLSESPVGQTEIATGMSGLINFGIFRLKDPALQPQFLEITAEAVRQIAGHDGLISTYFHRSLDGTRAVNYGVWKSQKQYANMVINPPMAEPLVQMNLLSNNEFQLSLYEVVFTQVAAVS